MNTTKRNENSKAMITTKRINILKYVHIAIIVLGALYILLPNFHTNLWFDESYSVAISKFSFQDIWNIGSNDVHPVLYYFILHIIGLFTNNSILSFRLLSVISIIILSIIGYTHIRKDFGDKVGIIFSFLVLFMPVVLVYSGEIRMYTFSMLLVTIMSIYGYRIYKSGVSNKNWIIFSIFSLASAYTHYYALATALVINLALFIYFLVMNIKQRNYEIKYIKYSGNLKRSIISAIVQIILYIPWLGTLIALTLKSSSGGFWIGKPNILQIFEFQFTGNLDSVYLIRNYSYVFSAIILLYLIFLLIKNWKKCKPAKLALCIYIIVIAFVGIISLIVTPILYARYFLIITGLFLFALAYLMSMDKNNIRTFIIFLIIVISSCMTNINLININYDSTNAQPKQYVSSLINSEDIIIVNNDLSGFIIGSEFPNNKLYFYDKANWNVSEAYKAFGTTVKDLNELQNFTGRIWIISSDNYNFADEVIQELGQERIDILNQEQFSVKYKNYRYAITLIERN